MSYNFSVYASSPMLPSISDLRARLGPRITFDDRTPLTSLRGYFHVLLNGEEAGFEVIIVKITDLDREDYRQSMLEHPGEDDGYLDALETGDVKFLFICQGEPAISAGRAFATALARAARAYFNDQQINYFKRLDEDES